MQETKTNELTLEKMRKKRSVSEAVFKKFTEAKNYFNTHAFCFYEGEDGKYYNSRIQNYFGDKFIPEPVGNKKEVLKLMKRIQSDALYSDACVMFFIDRDYDSSLENTNKDLYETPCYSIENLYAQEAVFIKILLSEFGLNITDEDYTKCLNTYRVRLNEFNDIILYFNALVKYQHQYAPDINCKFSNIKTSHIADITIDYVVKAATFDEEINSLKTQLNVDPQILGSIVNELKLEKKPHLVFRGKNQLDFLVKIVTLLKELNASKEFFSTKRNCVKINISNNRLSELSQYAITPNELNTFLELHLQTMLSKNPPT